MTFGRWIAFVAQVLIASLPAILIISADPDKLVAKIDKLFRK